MSWTNDNFEEPPPPFELSNADRLSPLWMRLLEHFNQELLRLRQNNDAHLDIVLTASLRGQISVYRRLLALDEPGPFVTGDADPP